MASTGGIRPRNVTGGSAGFNTSPEDAIDGGKKTLDLRFAAKESSPLKLTTTVIYSCG
jgi:hypothetical protein